MNNDEFDYHDIIHRLYVWNTKIGSTQFSNPYEFIEAMHEKAPFKGKVYYQNLLIELPKHFGAECRKSFFYELLQYFSNKINGEPSERLAKMQTFPFTNVEFYDLPDSLINFAFLNHNLDYVLTYFNQKVEQNFINNMNYVHININTYKAFNELVLKFCKERANNFENNKLNYIHLKDDVIECKNKVNKCIDIIEQHKHAFFDIEMFDPNSYTSKNWYELMYDQLPIIKNSLEYYELHLGKADTIKPKKSFHEYLFHPKSELLASELKKTFSELKGKRIRLMILALEQNEPKLISIGTREMKSLIESMRVFFNTEIGTYTGINDSLKNIPSKTLEIEIKSYKDKIQFILNTIEHVK
jgi:hypothetical protein